jgi:hypothetical protein
MPMSSRRRSIPCQKSPSGTVKLSRLGDCPQAIVYDQCALEAAIALRVALSLWGIDPATTAR